VPSARLHVREVLWEWSLIHLADVAELLTSELVTNGVRACGGLTGSRRDGRWVPGRPPVLLWLWADHERVLIQVWDGNDHLPARQQPDLAAEHGRGLLLVESLSSLYGVYHLVGWSGKVVWARLGA
jgi:hypothetical protein